MNLVLLIDFVRLALAAAGLVWVGRLLGTARLYLSWRTLACYAAAWLFFLIVCLTRLTAPASPLLLSLRLAFEALVILAAGGSLAEYLRADRRRHRDTRQLMAQWRLSAGHARQRANEVDALAALITQLVNNFNLRQVLPAVAEQALRLAGADGVVVYLVEPDTGRLRGQGALAVASHQRVAGQPAPRSAGMTSRVAASGEPAFVANVAQHPLFQDAPRPQLGALASLPLRFNGAVLGVLNVSYQQPRAFDPDDQRLLLALADLAGLALHLAAQPERLALPLSPLFKH